MKYKINEVFESLQGEGTYTGKPSIFIRLQGCPVGCPWCDTKHTWNVSLDKEISKEIFITKNIESDSWCHFGEKQIVELFKERGYQSKHIVITGGEPCMYDLTMLCTRFENEGYSCQVETSGTFDINVTENCWVTLSPKINMKGGYKVLSSSYKKASEIKYPIARESHVDELKKLIIENDLSTMPIYLQPISMGSKATKLAIASCIENNWRLSVQLHKYLEIE
ncbi:7-carboxy-7-deazaguanine synthase QueE [Psychromonas sp. MB-3u-54]|uniref:7-carboxy-7-deazaguanine synthase QueE n=1 Tax=Psychromonas sp. MB-3u-54 TaxID=2058319 RepID=UPI000C3465C4|nr:7-carboxy-7-deazaguanine synthase QueE [Psychromonas sp. MB-3u-54]PKH01382.1 7-carboxy-7-deazaguanine synthase QueE [Psychromonas sp. MB-3u-54]